MVDDRLAAHCTKGRRYYQMSPKWPRDLVNVILTSQMAVRELDDDNDNDKRPLVVYLSQRNVINSNIVTECINHNTIRVSKTCYTLRVIMNGQQKTLFTFQPN